MGSMSTDNVNAAGPAAAAGWYTVDGQQMYWTGTAWSGHTAPIVVDPYAPKAGYQSGLSTAAWICAALGLLVAGILFGPVAMMLCAMDNGRRRDHGMPAQYGPMVLGLIDVVAGVVMFLVLTSM